MLLRRRRPRLRADALGPHQPQPLAADLPAVALDRRALRDRAVRALEGWATSSTSTARPASGAATALIDAGGWHAETLTEDLDISYRAFLRGLARRLPARRRVAGGAAGQLRRLPAAAAPLGARQPRVRDQARPGDLALGRCPGGSKLQATLHLTGYSIHLLMLALCFLYPLLAAGRDALPGVAVAVRLHGGVQLRRPRADDPVRDRRSSSSARRWWTHAAAGPAAQPAGRRHDADDGASGLAGALEPARRLRAHAEVWPRRSAAASGCACATSCRSTRSSSPSSRSRPSTSAPATAALAASRPGRSASTPRVFGLGLAAHGRAVTIVQALRSRRRRRTMSAGAAGRVEPSSGGRSDRDGRSSAVDGDRALVATLELRRPRRASPTRTSSTSR